MTRWARPSASTRTDGTGLAAVPAATAAAASASASKWRSTLGPKGDGVSAARATRYGLIGLGKDRSKECPSYTGSKLRLERKARNLPSGVNDGDSSRNRPSVTSIIAGLSAPAAAAVAVPA